MWDKFRFRKKRMSNIFTEKKSSSKSINRRFFYKMSDSLIIREVLKSKFDTDNSKSDSYIVAYSKNCKNRQCLVC